jgi:hypothetical protein
MILRRSQLPSQRRSVSWRASQHAHRLLCYRAKNPCFLEIIPWTSRAHLLSRRFFRTEGGAKDHGFAEEVRRTALVMGQQGLIAVHAGDSGMDAGRIECGFLANRRWRDCDRCERGDDGMCKTGGHERLLRAMEEGDASRRFCVVRLLTGWTESLEHELIGSAPRGLRLGGAANCQGPDGQTQALAEQ